LSSFGRLFDQIFGHEDAKTHFAGQVTKGSMAHCQLFVGPEGIGKKLFATALAQEILCQEKKENKACGFCPHCIRVAKGQHESLLIIEPETKFIKLDQAREVQKFLQLSRMGVARIIIIDQAEKMNPQAANALLKTLEEPPEETFFFLITGNQHQLLSTIRSRAQLFRFKPISLDILRKKSTASEWQIQASSGSIADLKSWQEESKLEFRQSFLEYFEALKGLSYAEIKYQCTEWAKDDKQFRECLKLFQYAIRDALYYPISSESVRYFPDQMNFIEKLAKIGPDGLQFLHDLCFNIELDLDVNIDKALHLENLSFRIKSLSPQ
jgi:DNA polymerase-3 subunit delta'